MQVAQVNIAKKLQESFHLFSKGQKKIATAILTHYDKVAFMTAGRLGKFSGVSESTVVRFATELGYDGYAEFQHAIQELVRSRLTPNQRIELTKNLLNKKDLLENVMFSDVSKIRSTFETLNKDHFYKAVDSILNAKTIYVIGARSSDTLAQLLSYNLSLILDNVKHVKAMSNAEIFEQMFTIDKDDVLIAFSFPRYSSKIVSAVNFASQNEATVIAFTDSPASPIAEFSTYLLLAQSDMASFMDSFVAPMSLINAMMILITQKKESEIRKRFDRLEKVWDQYGVYTKR